MTERENTIAALRRMPLPRTRGAAGHGPRVCYECPRCRAWFVMDAHREYLATPPELEAFADDHGACVRKVRRARGIYREV